MEGVSGGGRGGVEKIGGVRGRGLVGGSKVEEEEKRLKGDRLFKRDDNTNDYNHDKYDVYNNSRIATKRTATKNSIIKIIHIRF